MAKARFSLSIFIFIYFRNVDINENLPEKINLFKLKGQFTPRINSLKYIWDMERNNYY